MSEISKPPVVKYWVAYGAGDTVHMGVTDTNQVTTTGQPNLEFFDDEQGQLSAVEAALLPIPDMPAEGSLIGEGETYKYAGVNYRVRQSHARTADDPSTVPALFTTVRPPGEYMEWIPQEQVYVGDRRGYSGDTYECIQSHQTQVDWTPPSVPALWQLHVDAPAGEWAPRLTVAVDDELDYLGVTYKCLQAHTTQVGWEPPNVPALWSVVSVGGEWAAGVSYSVDDEVTYNTVNYVCLQAHTSQVGWEPPNVPALWAEVVTSSDWAAGVAYSVDDEVTYNTVNYVCLQAHTSQVGWEPPNVPALWSEVSEAAAPSQWTTGVSYSVDDTVINQGSTYLCIQSHSSNPSREPPNATYWQLI